LGYRVFASLAMLPFNFWDQVSESSSSKWSHPVWVNETNWTNVTEYCEDRRKHLVNTLGGNTGEGRKARWLYWTSLLLWAVTRVAHDWCLLWGFSDFVTLTIDLARHRIQQVAYLAGFAWALSSTEVFLARPEPGGCPCYYELPENSMLMAFATPAMLYVSNLTRKVNLYKAMQSGDFLNSPDYHVPFRVVRASSPRDPDAPLLVAGMRGDPILLAEEASQLPAVPSEPHAEKQDLTLPELHKLWTLDWYLCRVLFVVTRGGVLAMTPIFVQLFILSTRKRFWSLEGFPLQVFMILAVPMACYVSVHHWYQLARHVWTGGDLRNLRQWTKCGMLSAIYHTAVLLWCGIAPPITLSIIMLQDCSFDLPQWGNMVNCTGMPLNHYWTVCACLTSASFSVISWYCRKTLAPVKKLLDLRCFEGEDMSREEYKRMLADFTKDFPTLPVELGLDYHFAFLKKAADANHEDVLPGKALKLMGRHLLERENKRKERGEKRRSHHETQKELMDEPLFSEVLREAGATNVSPSSYLPCNTNEVSCRSVSFPRRTQSMW